MHRFFWPAVAGLVLVLAAPAPAKAAGGGGNGGGGIGMSLGGGGFGHAGLGGGGTGVGHATIGVGTGSAGHGTISFGGRQGAIGLGSSHDPVGSGLTRGIGSPGGDDLHLGLSSRELGLGNNFGLNAPDNVLSRAARLPTAPNLPGLGQHAGDRPSLLGADLKTGSDDSHSPQDANDARAGGGDAKVQNVKKLEGQGSRSSDIEEQELLLQEQKLQANTPQAPSPPAAQPTMAPSISQPPPTLPEDSTVVTTSLGSGEVQMIGAYFAQNGAPVASMPTSSVNISVGGTIPEGVALFPPPYDLANQLSDSDFLYFVWGQNVVIVDGQTNVATAIVPDVLAHQD